MIVCEMINYALEQDCLCGESALSFCSFGYMKMWLEEDWEEARRWGKMAARILDKAKRHQPFTCTCYKCILSSRFVSNFPHFYHLTLHIFTGTRVTLFTYLLVWDRPLQESARDLFTAYEMGMKSGEGGWWTSSLMIIHLSFNTWYISSNSSLFFVHIQTSQWRVPHSHSCFISGIIIYAYKNAPVECCNNSIISHLLLVSSSLPLQVFIPWRGNEPLDAES